ncbi:MAG: hypothetical protein V7707_20890 [Motiliproteus sp.]
MLENILLPLQLNGRMDERPRALMQMQRLGIKQQSLQLDDGRELMLFQIRGKQGHPLTQ